MTFKPHYSRFLTGLGERLHFRAHSHHPWPDCTREAQLLAWDDAALHSDEKWERVFGELVPEAQRSIADTLRLSDSNAIAFAPNTHEFVARLISCLPHRPRVLTTDSEFHSFSRQAARLEEDGARVERIAAEPFETFSDRFVTAAKRGDWDMIFLSQVFFNSGYRVPDEALVAVAAHASEKTFVVVDGYHAFMAVQVDLSRVCASVFYLAGGYKYAQAGEGVCFMAVPERCSARPRNTGWFADFGGLEGTIASPVGYGEHGWKFWGSTLDPSGLYRLNAVSRWRKTLGLDVAASDRHVRSLQRRFLDRLSDAGLAQIPAASLIGSDLNRFGHFLTFRLPDSVEVCRRLAAQQRILADARGDRLRFGFGLYQDEADVDAVFERLRGS